MKKQTLKKWFDKKTQVAYEKAWKALHDLFFTKAKCKKI